MFSLILTAVVSYIAGSFPTSILVSRRSRGIDIREFGSGNAGATNVARILGFRAALVVALVDVFKGFIPVLLTLYLRFPEQAGYHYLLFPVVAGGAAVLGHIFPIFAGFRGGKGVATSAGAVLALYPLALVFSALVALPVLFFTGIVSLTSIIAAFSLPLVYLAITSVSPEQVFHLPVFLFLVFIALIVAFSHRKNIGRLAQGEEPRFEKLRLFRRR